MIRIIPILLTFQFALIFVIDSFGQTRPDSASIQELRKKEFNISPLEKIDYPLPKDAKKLKPKQNKAKLQLGIQRLQYNIWKNLYSSKPSYIVDQKVQTYRRYFEKPQFLQLDLAYQIIPWIQAGILTHKRKGLMNSASYRQDNLAAYLELKIDFKRTWGAFVEFSPLPVRYLRLRRWEFNLGASINKESIITRQFINGSYRLEMMDWRKFTQEKEQTISLISSQFYGGFRIYLLPSLSMNVKIGYYYIPPLKIDGFIINIPDPFQELHVGPEPINLSWHFYSLGLNIHL